MRIFKTPPFPQKGNTNKKSFCVTIDFSNRWVATGNSDSTIHIFDELNFKGKLENDKSEILLKFDDFKPVLDISSGDVLCDIYCVSFIPTEAPNSLKLIAGDSIGRIHIIDIRIEDADGKHRPKLSYKSNILLDLTRNNSPEISKLLFPNITDKNLQKTDEDNSFLDISVSSDKRLFALTCLNGKVLIFDLPTRKLIHVIHFPKDTNVSSNTQVLVKTLSFDPTNNYLTIISNEKQVYIYQYFYDSISSIFHKKLIHTISKNSQKSLRLTRFNRFNWCPSGALLAIPNSAIEPSFTSSSTSTNNSSASSSTLSNETANATAVSAHVPINLPSESGNVTHSYSISTISSIAMTSPLSNFKNVYFSLIGHDFSSIETAKFAPYMVSTSPVSSDISPAKKENTDYDKNIEKKYNYIIATAGIDRSLIIWSTKFERPTFAAVEFSESSILDLCWLNPDYSSSSLPKKFGLFAISENGSLGYVKFDSESEFCGFGSLSTNKKSTMNVANLKELESAKNEVIKELSCKPLEVETKSLEAKLKQEEPNINEKKEKTEPKILKSSDKLKAVLIAKITNSENTDPSISSTASAVTLVKNGTKTKKRIAPTQVISSSISSNSHEMNRHQQDNAVRKSKQINVINGYQKPFSEVPKDVAKKHSESGALYNDENSNIDLHASKRQKIAIPNVEFLHSQIIINASLAFAKLRLAFPKPAKNLLLELTTKNSSSHSKDIADTPLLNSPTSLQLCVVNGSGNEQKPTRISLVMGGLSTDLTENTIANPLDSSSNSKLTAGSAINDKNKVGEAVDKDATSGQKEVFVDFVPKLINLVTSAGIHNDPQSEEVLGQFWALATMDGTIIVYSASGKRLLPTMVLGVPISFLECKGRYLMAVTCIGELYVWDICSRKIHFRPVLLYSLLEPGSKYLEDVISKGDNLTMCSITASGVPIVTLSNGNGYMYDRDMETWCLVSSSWWVFGSHYWDSMTSTETGNETTKADIMTNSNKPNDNSGIISLIESRTNEEILRKRKTDFIRKASKMILAKHGYENLEISISLAHLENKIIVAEKLGDKKEFKRLLVTYCKRICELAYKNRLINVFLDLLGPIDEDEEEPEEPVKSDDKWKPSVCGYDKRKLLKELILACASYREVQRVLIMYGKEIGLVTSDIIP